jgi:hypothetical protein
MRGARSISGASGLAAVIAAASLGLWLPASGRAQSSATGTAGTIRPADVPEKTRTAPARVDSQVRRTRLEGDYPTAQGAIGQPPSAPSKPQPPAAPEPQVPAMPQYPVAPPAAPTYGYAPAYPAAPTQGYYYQAVPMMPSYAMPAYVPPVAAPAAPAAPNYFLPAAPAAAAPAPMGMMAMPALPMMPAAVQPAAAPAGVAGLTSQAMSVPSLNSRSRFRVRTRPFGGLASRMGEALQNYGRQRLESTQEVEVGQASAPVGGVTNISTTSAVPQAPQQSVTMYPTAPQPPAAPPGPSPQTMPKTHHWFGHGD